ncbi:RNA-binding protein precursor, putative [Trichomonas vaginalis G3]|uniref:receptor protein-tyrosine kinase n=1 Tax=Trichomonas vaginalis (strain ATCC PRA-98 / G3) TaxID=412133 RepID=A2ENG7_TRIV3|nr:glycine-rich protein family [Trichomonas vaginalis G3]EAY05837.1 RNA-binding protein precursor, putative [Trichomonas vaginalis G3]KAI5516387.1 glycine-rich protein family [Trichomonas vaginalis G3]|eukprot:XP_001318060.1 RNA-binding protein precursor [Trichomonas vaginalis G3]
MIQIKEVVDLFVFVGEQGKSGGGFNSNSQLMTISGGGATDIRLTNTTNWYDFDSLKSRIMVAAGAGSGERYCGGDGGSLIGLSTDSTYSKPGYSPSNQSTGGTQITGSLNGCYNNYRLCGSSGKFGIGEFGNNADDNGPSGGGVYYGGGGIAFAGSAGGGSSFISGFQNCDAIYENSTENKIYHSGQPFHYSGKYFTDGIMIDGQHEMPSTDLKSTEVGHDGHGYAIITYIVSNVVFSCQMNIYLMKFFLITNSFLMIS